MKARLIIAALVVMLGLVFGSNAQAVEQYYNVHYPYIDGCYTKTFQSDFWNVGIQARSGSVNCYQFIIMSYGYSYNLRTASPTYPNHNMAFGYTLHNYNSSGQCYVEFEIISYLGHHAAWRLYTANNYWVRLW